MFGRPMSRPPYDAALPPKRASRVGAAACALVLASAAHSAFGFRFDPHIGCHDLCSEEFWAEAGAGDVVAELAREPGAVSYRGHVLRLAVSSGAHADAVAVLLRAGAPPNARDDDRDGGRYVLQDAVLFGTKAPSDEWGDDGDPDRFAPEDAAQRSADIVAVLLDAGAFPRLADNTGRTPLHEAAQFGRTGAAARLVAAGASRGIPDDSGATPVGLARRHGHGEILALLRAPPGALPTPCGRLCTAGFWKSASTTQVREALMQAAAGQGRSPRGDTPLHLALAMGADVETVKVVLDRGADPNARNARDDTPLHVAAGAAGGAEATAILLARGAMPDVANAEDRTPLHVASERAAMGIMRALLDAGADPDIRSGVDGHTARELAARQPEGPQATELLLDYGTGPVIEPRRTGLMPLLHYAAESGHPDTVTMLLDLGVHPQEPDIFGNTAIHKAAHAGNVATMRVLLTRGANPNHSKYDTVAVLSGEGERPLHRAVHHPAAVALLLEFGADPDGRIRFTGETPFHLAARHCQGASLELLLAAGADPNARGQHRSTPLSNAMMRLEDSGAVRLETWLRSCEKRETGRNLDACKAMVTEDFKRRFERRDECERNIIVLIGYGAR